MSKFKGTHGKWKLGINRYGYYTSVRNMDDTRKICVSRVNNFEEQNANMLLISKAPEMLEMLEKYRNHLRDHYSHDVEELNQFIAEITEL